MLFSFYNYTTKKQSPHILTIPKYTFPFGIKLYNLKVD